MFIKDLLRPFWYIFRFHIRLVAEFYPKYFGLENLDEKLEKYLDFRNGYFVEIGANDGLTQSNTKYFELFRGWRGVLVEPYYENYKKCMKNRNRNSKVFHAACVSFSSSVPQVELLYSNLMTIGLSDQFNKSDQMNHAKAGEKFLKKGEVLHSFVAPARTLSSILDEACAPRVIDLLSLDVEGMEMEVLLGIDHGRYRFNYICVEVRNEAKMTRLLSAFGYVLVEKLSGNDFLSPMLTQQVHPWITKCPFCPLLATI